MATSLAEERGQIHGAPRQLEDGTYHVTDLLRRPAALLYDWYTGREQPDGIPPWLARRGEALEEAALDMMGIPEGARQPEIRYSVPDSDATITGHPDYIQRVDGVVEVGEVKSQLGTDDDARRDLAVEQALAYAGLENRLGDQLEEGGVRVERVRAVMAGLYDIDDTETVPVRDLTTSPIVDYMEAKARFLHEAIEAGDRTLVEEFDEQRPPTSEDGYSVTPIADGELGETCDRIVAASILKSYVEDVYDGLRDQYQATAEQWHEDAGEPGWDDVETKRYAPRLGGTVNVVCRTVKEIQDSDKLDRYRDDLGEMDEEWEQVQEDALADLRAEHADLLESILDKRKEVQRLEEQLTVERKEPSYARAWKPGDASVQDALGVLFDDEEAS